MSKSSDRFSYAIGILIIGIVAWKLIGYLLPDRIVTPTSEEFLEIVMDNSGGMEQWKSIKKMSFSKDFQLFKEDGRIEIDRNELHTYDFNNQVNRLIQWKENSNTYNLIQKDDLLYQTVNTQTDSSLTKAQLQNKLNAATFVIGLPFTLKDSNANLNYEGLNTFEGTEAHDLKVSFTGSKDIWHLYYDTSDQTKWLGYWVQTGDHYSLVINEQQIQEDGFTFSRKRKSYRTDAERNKTYLRAQYQYDNFDVKF